MPVTCGGIAGESVPLHWTPSPEPITEPGAPTFLYCRAPPFSRCEMFRETSADCGEKFATVAEQWLAVGAAFVLAGNVVGLQLLLSVTTPCFFTNATGIVTLLPPLRGTRLIRPWYEPVAASGAEIVTGKVTVPFFATWIALPSLTTIETPAGAVICASRVWFLPETFMAVRCVVTEPVIVVASIDGMFRSIRCSVSEPAATKFAYVSLKTSVGLTARSARIEPAPMSNASAGVTPSSLTTVWTDEVISADLIIGGVQVGWAALTSAETPAACGLDIEVPAIAMNRFPGGPLSAVVWSGCGVVPASTWTPGAVTSGLIQSPSGPRDEKAAIMSACPGCAVPCAHVAITLVWPLTKLRNGALGPSMWMAGR